MFYVFYYIKIKKRINIVVPMIYILKCNNYIMFVDHRKIDWKAQMFYAGIILDY